MGVSLKYDLDQLNTGKTNIENLKTDIADARDAMIKGLAQIKQDWVSEGSDAFFDSIDNDWLKGIENCITVLDDMMNALEKAHEKYEEIETNAPGYLKF